VAKLSYPELAIVRQVIVASVLSYKVVVLHVVFLSLQYTTTVGPSNCILQDVVGLNVRNNMCVVVNDNLQLSHLHVRNNMCTSGDCMLLPNKMFIACPGGECRHARCH